MLWAAIIIGFGASLLSGVIVQDTWAWFVAPITELGAISYAQALGLTVFASVFGLRAVQEERDASKSERNLRLLKGALTRLVALLLLWGVGWIVAGCC